MFDYTQYQKNDVFCIDMKSFYASCECILRGLDPMTTKLAVVGDVNRNGSVVLASSPLMKKKYRIKTGSRLYDIKKINDPEVIIAQARMGSYLKISNKIIGIFESLVPSNHIHVYSVDESWLTFRGCDKNWGTPFEAAENLIKKIKDETGIVATIGIGDNKFLAKACLDIYAKHAINGVDEIRYEQVEEKLHPVKIEEMWMCGAQMTKHFNDWGIHTIGDLANAPFDVIKRRFGKNGETLYWYAWGIDLSPVVYDKDNLPQTAFGFVHGSEKPAIKSIGRSIILLRDYTDTEEILLIIRELIEEVCVELRKEKLYGKTIHLSFGYSKTSSAKGFSRQKTIKEFTDDAHEIFMVCKVLLDEFHIFNEPVRQIRVSVGKMSAAKRSNYTLEGKNKRKKISEMTDLINEKFGKGTVRKASSFSESSIMKDRAKKVNGHFE